MGSAGHICLKSFLPPPACSTLLGTVRGDGGLEKGLNQQIAGGRVTLALAALRTEMKLPFQLLGQVEEGVTSKNVQKT